MIYVEAEHGDETREIDAGKFNETAISPDVRRLEKNPSRYQGKTGCYRGRIGNILEEGKWLSQIQLYTRGYCSGQVFVFHPGVTSFVKGNRIWACGHILGSYTYRSQAGWNITVPALLAHILVSRMKTPR